MPVLGEVCVKAAVQRLKIVEARDRVQREVSTSHCSAEQRLMLRGPPSCHWGCEVLLLTDGCPSDRDHARLLQEKLALREQTEAPPVVAESQACRAQRRVLASCCVVAREFFA